MNRRRLLILLAGVGSVGSLSLGSSAFSSVSAGRRLTVKVAGDNDARLMLTQLGDGRRSFETGSPETVELALPTYKRRSNDPNLGLGVDSVYEFDLDNKEEGSASPKRGLIRIENRGSQSVEVYSEDTSLSEVEIEIYDVTDSDKTALRDDPIVLGIGDSVAVGIRVRTFDASPGTFPETLTIVAETTN